MSGIYETMNTAYRGAINTGYYTIECTGKLLSSVDSVSQITRLGTVVLKALKDYTGHAVADGLFHACEAFVDWASATKLPSRSFELISGGCVQRPFMGFVNIPKVVSRLALVANDFFNAARHLVSWGLVTKEVGKFLTFGLKDATIKEFTHYSGLTAWTTALADDIDSIYQNGPSLQKWLSTLSDGAKVSSILLSSNKAGILGVVSLGSQALAPLFSIAKTIVKEYDIQIPRAWYV